MVPSELPARGLGMANISALGTIKKRNLGISTNLTFDGDTMTEFGRIRCQLTEIEEKYLSLLATTSVLPIYH